MTEETIHAQDTRFGFQFGNADVSRCWSHKGAVCIRVKSMTSGEFIDIQVSPAGRKMHISKGKMRLYKDDGEP